MGKWLDKARIRKEEIESERQTLQNRIASLQSEFEAERQNLLGRIDAARAENESNLSAYRNGQSWSDIDLRSTVTVGTKVIYFGKWYTCIKEHTKSLLNSPVSGTYWEEE